MAKYGKWLGGTLGWAFGGPIGAILGFVFGSMYDNMNSGEQTYAKTQRGDFSVSLLILSAAVMKADGKVLKSELDYVKKFFIRQFGMEETENKMRLLREIMKQDIPVVEVCGQIKQHMEYETRLQLLHYLFGISLADNHLDPSEINIIQLIAGATGLSSNDYESVKAMFVKDNTSAYRILEADPTATDEEVKKAYRQMAVKYHPDKVSHLGDDIQRAAQEKFQVLNAAYDTIKKERGLN